MGLYHYLIENQEVHFEIYASQGLKTYKTREDQINGLDQHGLSYLKSLRILFFRKEVVIQFPTLQVFRCDFLIVHDEAKYLLNYTLWFFRRLFKFKTIFFTHGEMIHGKNMLLKKVYPILTHKSDYFLTYTPYSTDYLVQLGIDRFRIAHFMNTIDTRGLDKSYYDVEQVYHTKDDFKLAFVGTLHSERRFEKVLEVFEYLYQIDDRYTLDVYGAGPLLETFRNLNIPNIVFHGFVGGKDLQIKLKRAKFVLNPGLIGLNVIDCIFSSVIMITDVNYKRHSPELYYLQTHNIALQVDWSKQNVFRAILNYSKKDYLQKLESQKSLREELTSEKMAERVIEAIKKWEDL